MKRNLSTNVRSPFRYPGGKMKHIKYIRPYWERVLHDEYREPFFGGGAVFFAKPKVEYNWLNDLLKDLIITLKIMADPESRLKIIGLLSNEVATKERFEEMKSWNPQTELEKAHRFYYINRTAYSGIMKQPNWGFHDIKSVPPRKWPDRVENAGRKLEGSKITSIDFLEVIEAPPDGKSVFMYVDPPYCTSDQKRAYLHHFSLDDHLRLHEALKETEYKFCLSYDDCDQVRDLYDWANLYTYSWRYHAANSSVTSRKMGEELIITNY